MAMLNNQMVKSSQIISKSIDNCKAVASFLTRHDVPCYS